jgi:predicted permease
LRCGRTDVAGVLRASRGSTVSFGARGAMVAAQVALCTLILMGAALLVATLQRLRTMDAGFDRDHVITLTLDPGLNGLTEGQSRELSQRLLERTRALPGVASAAIASRAVMRGTGVKATLGVAGSRITSGDFLNSSLNEVTPGYFATMGMRMLAGRDFDGFDRNRGAPRKAIVNAAFVRRFFAGRNALGRRFGFAGAGGIAKAENEIIGVVSDARYRSLREPVPPTVYHPVVDGFEDVFILHVRTRQPPEVMLAAVESALREEDAALPLIEARTLHEEVEASLWQERLLALLASLFGGIAAILASIGLYGALDYAVKSRTREIGVRMALGARPVRVVRLFSREALILTGCGLAVGLVGYWAASAWLRVVLFDVRPWEPGAVIVVVAVVGLIAIAAAAPAAYRAARVDPAAALRAE